MRIRVRPLQYEYIDGRRYASVDEVLAFVHEQADAELPGTAEVIEKLEDHLGPSIVGHPREEAYHVHELIMADRPRDRISRARMGMNKLFERYPLSDIRRMTDDPESPWLTIDIVTYPDLEFVQQYAIWKQTGNVYRCNYGEVEDDPFLEVTSLQ